MMNLYQLTTFVTVISEGSMTAAADKLYLTQPAVSQQIRNLEEDLGVELLVRGVRQIKASPQGEVLYEHARKILQLAQQAEIAIKSIGAELKGQIRIGTLNSIGLHIMSPLMGRLMRHNPDLQIKVEYKPGEELVKAFKKGQFDVLILPQLQEEFGLELDNVEEKFLLKEEMWLVVSGKETDIPAQINAKELSHFPMVNFVDEFPGFNQKLQKLMSGAGISPKAIFESSNVGTLKRVIESGLGWGFLPAHSIRKQVRSGRLNHVHVKEFHYEIDMTYYFRKTSEARQLAEILYQTIATQEKA
ncbi:LysR family transcriptional regulator [Bdellovibrio sp. HCB337]|uniref:LysR family transcriptional regulator n=1 Tax=Bdellovibrio sp. HCB337 TaxID=3394358 RepID=UPI0039A53BF8